MESKPNNDPEAEATPEMVEALRSRVQDLGNHILFYEEVEKITPLSIRVIYKEINRRAKDWEAYDLIIDVRKTKRSNATIREMITEESKRFLLEKQRNVVLIMGSNIVISF